MTKSIADRVQRYQQQATKLAASHVETLIKSMEDLRTITDEISKGGEAYHIGIRASAERLEDQLRREILGIRSLYLRNQKNG